MSVSHSKFEKRHLELSSFWLLFLWACFSLILGRGLRSRFPSKNFWFYYRFMGNLYSSPRITCDYFWSHYKEMFEKNWNANTSVFGALYTIVTIKHRFFELQFAIKICISFFQRSLLLLIVILCSLAEIHFRFFLGWLHVTIFCNFSLQNNWLIE